MKPVRHKIKVADRLNSMVKIPYKSIAGTAASAPMHSKQGWGWRSLCQLEEALQQASM
jgi:hypothetical protein